MSGGVTPVLRNVVDRLTRNLTRTLDLGTRSVARTYERTSGTTRTALRTVDNADTSIGHHLLEETRTVSQPNPMRICGAELELPPQRYRVDHGGPLTIH